MFHVNIDCDSKQHELIGLCNGDWVFTVRYEWNFKDALN